VACGPGNNGKIYPLLSLFNITPTFQRIEGIETKYFEGGDGLVAARHLHHYGYSPTIYYPKNSQNDLYERLSKQLKNLNVPFTEDFEGSLKESHHVIDAIFGICLKLKHHLSKSHI